MAQRAWYEIWADEALSPPYVLLLNGYDDGELQILDPITETVAFTTTDYQEANNWLLEDRFKRVSNRLVFGSTMSRN